MCILLKLHYAKFDVSRLFRSKVSEEKRLGVRFDPPLVKEQNISIVIIFNAWEWNKKGEVRFVTFSAEDHSGENQV